MLGQALKRCLADHYPEYALIKTPRRNLLDFKNEARTKSFIKAHKPDHIILTAARVGGIRDNMDHPVEFLTDNLAIQNNVMQAAHEAGVESLLFTASTCLYPPSAPQPYEEESLLSGPLEVTNKAYALAKLSGIELAKSYAAQYGRHYRSALLTNLYGPYDHFDEQASHVIPALILKIVRAKQNDDEAVSIWGSGKPTRYFLYVDDAASALMYVLKKWNDPEPINIASGCAISIAEIAQTIADIAKFKGKLVFDTAQPEGVASKSVNISKINNLGWKAETSLKDGLSETITWYQQSLA